MNVCVCVCVCVSEGERERKSETMYIHYAHLLRAKFQECISNLIMCLFLFCKLFFTVICLSLLSIKV
jgi:hypothetical protein